MFAAATGFGTIGIFGEIAANIDFPLATLLPFRFVVATVVVLALAAVREWPLPPGRRGWLVTLTLGVVYASMTLLYFLSLRYLTAGLASIVLYTAPTFVVILSATFLDERITLRTLLAVALAIGGVALVVGTDTAGADPIGVVLGLGAAVCYAVYMTGSRSALGGMTPRPLMVGVLLGTTVSMAVYGVLDGRFTVPSGGAEWGVVLGLALVSTVVPHVLFYEGVDRLEASRVGVVSTVEPVVTVFLGAALLDEAVTPFVVAGGALVLGGVLLVQRDRAEAGESARAAGSSD